MTYDQFQRYSVLKLFLDFFYSQRKALVLDIGGLSPVREGHACFLPIKLIFSGRSLSLDPTPCCLADFIQGEGTRLPFKDKTFDVVSALDVIEHISPQKRDAFIEEMCRVSKDSVLLSAPFKNKEIEDVENLLFCQLKKQYGIEHQQLLEHKKYGLPEIDEISQLLTQHMQTGSSFSYGSLKNWLVLQSIKNSFMLAKSSGKIHAFLDKWFAENSMKQEFEHPPSRHFWIYSQDIKPVKLEKGLARLQKALKHTQESLLKIEDFKEFHGALVDYLCQDHISALVVTEGQSDYFTECLNHVLTQKIDNDFEVAIWDITGDERVQNQLQSHFPDVAYFTSDHRDRLLNAWLKVTSRLKGDFLLVLSDEVLLPSNSVAHFYQELNNRPQAGILSPRIDKENQEVVTWEKTWIQSNCLFFRRDGQYQRKWQDSDLTKSNIFKWELTETAGEILYSSQFTVYEK